MTAKAPEVLSPAGSPEALTAAVRCGADAVYCGLRRDDGLFNARRAATNFAPDELADAVRYCHARGVAVHVALNTLVRQDELSAAMDAARIACDAGADALIVQDLGLARRLRAACPAMPLHASTQLSCHTPAGAALLRDAGFSRVVLAREMTIDEIRACTDLGIETEVFVHGALCMSVSGQCYFSAMLGGRSGNRGACAQPCRLPFCPTGDRPRPCPPDAAALSLKDNCQLLHVAQLSAAGVTSLKIEGRMKRPEYVAAATALYRAAAHGEPIDPAALDRLQSVFSRSGFTDGYLTGQRSSAMFGTRRHEDVLAASGVLGALQHTYDREQPRVPVTFTLCVSEGGVSLTATDAQGRSARAESAAAEPAQHRPLDPQRAAEQLKKTGGTPFFVPADGVRCSIASGLTVAMSALNALRRQALDALLRQREDTPPVPFSPDAAVASLPTCAPSGVPKTVVILPDADLWPAAAGADLLVVPLSTTPQTLHELRAAGTAAAVEVPRGMFGEEEHIRRALAAAADAGACAALIGNIGALPLARAAGLPAIGDFGLNITNGEALAFYREQGLTAATLSPELTFAQLRAMLSAPLPVGLTVYGRQPLMLTRNCPRKAAVGSCRGCTGQGLTDRTGTVFPVRCCGGCAQVFNSVPLYVGDLADALPPIDFALLRFTTEQSDRIAAVLSAYAAHAPLDGPITRGLYRRGVG